MGQAWYVKGDVHNIMLCYQDDLLVAGQKA